MTVPPLSSSPSPLPSQHPDAPFWENVKAYVARQSQTPETQAAYAAILERTLGKKPDMPSST